MRRVILLVTVLFAAHGIQCRSVLPSEPLTPSDQQSEQFDDALKREKKSIPVCEYCIVSN